MRLVVSEASPLHASPPGVGTAYVASVAPDALTLAPNAATAIAAGHGESVSAASATRRRAARVTRWRLRARRRRSGTRAPVASPPAATAPPTQAPARPS